MAEIVQIVTCAPCRGTGWIAVWLEGVHDSERILEPVPEICPECDGRGRVAVDSSDD